MEKLQKLMNAMVLNTDMKSAVFYLNECKKNINDILNSNDARFIVESYAQLSKNMLFAAGIDGIKAKEIFYYEKMFIHFENDNHKILPSRLNSEYDHKLFTASCAAMTGILASQSSKDIQNEDVITYMAINQAKGLIEALNKE